MGAMASQVTSLTIVYSTVESATDEEKHQSSAALDFVRGIHRWPVNSPHKGSVRRKIFPFDDVIMNAQQRTNPVVNTLRPRENYWHFADDIFKSFFLDWEYNIGIKMYQKVVPKGPIKNGPALVMIMA